MLRKLIALNQKGIWLSILLAASLLITGCPTSPSASPLPEIREYQGQKLSSVNDFRENSIKGPQQINIETYRLKISGLVATPKEYTYSQVLSDRQTYKKVITLHCVEGWNVTLLWEGILLKDLFNEAGMKPEAKTVIFHSYDGYTTSLPVDYFVSRNIMMAFKMNEIPIPPERGYPFMVACEDKWGYKWAKWVTEIELSADTKYRGWWESRGYSNTGDYPGIYFEVP